LYTAMKFFILTFSEAKGIVMLQVHRFQFGNEATRLVTKNDARCPAPSSLRMR